MSEHWDAQALLDLIPLIHKRVAEINEIVEKEKTRPARQKAYEREAAALRKKHGL